MCVYVYNYRSCVIRLYKEESMVNMVSRNFIQVPNVQELAASDDISSELSHRYIRPETETETVSEDMHVDLPIVDFSHLFDTTFFEEESSKLELACEEWGFFQLINHGIQRELMNNLKEEIMKFFELPLKGKKVYAQLPGGLEGYGQAFVSSEDKKLEWADMIYMVTLPEQSRNFKFWPSHSSTFRDTLDKYSSVQNKLAQCLLKILGRISGLDEETSMRKFNLKSQTMRINYYPPCKSANKVLGLAPHTDASGLTMLLQVNETQGLQIKKDGKWFPVKALPDALIVNIGHVLEMMSNGKFKSIEHRVSINPEKKRLSIAAFHNPTSEVVIGPLPELLKENEERYRSMSYADYIKAYFASAHDGKSILEKMRITK